VKIESNTDFIYDGYFSYSALEMSSSGFRYILFLALLC